jgi:hypothetical protein
MVAYTALAKKDEVMRYLKERVFQPLLDYKSAPKSLKRGVCLTINRMDACRWKMQLSCVRDCSREDIGTQAQRSTSRRLVLPTLPVHVARRATARLNGDSSSNSPFLKPTDD